MNYGSVAPNASRQNLESLIFKKVFTQVKPAVVAIANGFANYANWAVTKTHVRKIQMLLFGITVLESFNEFDEQRLSCFDF